MEIGNCSGQEVDKFAKFGLTPLPASKVKAPLVAECLRNLECLVVERVASRNLFILEGVKAWHNPEIAAQPAFHANGDGTFVIDGETVNLRHKMTKWQDCI